MVLELREDTGAVDVEMDPVDMARVSEVIHAAGQRCGVLDIVQSDVWKHPPAFDATSLSQQSCALATCACP